LTTLTLGDASTAPGEKSTGFIDVGDDDYWIPVAIVSALD
jgi:hypothetical protein